MVYFYGSDELRGQLGAYTLTDDLESSQCAVVEMPGNLEILNQIPEGMPVFVIINNGMLNFSEVRATKRQGVKVVKIDALFGELDSILSAGSEISSGHEEDMFLFEEDAPEEIKTTAKPVTPATPQEPVKPVIKSTPTITTIPKIPVTQKPVPAAIKPADSNRPGEPGSLLSRLHKEKEALPERSVSQPARSGILQRGPRRAPIAVSYAAEGGAGKTFLATNIGACGALTGVPTVLVDLDLSYGDTDTAVGLTDPENREKVIDKKARGPKKGWVTVSDWRRHTADLKSNILQHNSGLYVIPAYPYAGRDVQESEIEELIYHLSGIFGFMVVDLGVDAFSPQSRTVIRMADLVMLVGGQTEKTIGKVKHFLTQEGGYNKTRLCFNMVTPMGLYDPDVIAKKLGFSTYHEIPLDHAGVNSAKKQQKLAVQLPGCQAGDAVKRYAADVLPIRVEAPAVNESSKSGMSIFSKLFRKLKK